MIEIETKIKREDFRSKINPSNKVRVILCKNICVEGNLTNLFIVDGAFFFSYMGIAAALVFCNFGAAYGTAKSGSGLANLCVVDNAKTFKGLIPVVMAGILGIYGLIVAVVINSKIKGAGQGITLQDGYKYFGAGLTNGLSAVAAGLAIGIAGEAGVRAYAQTEAIFVGMILIMIFAEAIGLYGLIIAIVMVV